MSVKIDPERVYVADSTIYTTRTNVQRSGRREFWGRPEQKLTIALLLRHGCAAVNP